MKDSPFEIQQNQLSKSIDFENNSTLLNYNKQGKIKSRLGFIYFFALAATLIILFVK